MYFYYTLCKLTTIFRLFISSIISYQKVIRYFRVIFNGFITKWFRNKCIITQWFRNDVLDPPSLKWHRIRDHCHFSYTNFQLWNLAVWLQQVNEATAWISSPTMIRSWCPFKRTLALRFYVKFEFFIKINEKPKSRTHSEFSLSEKFNNFVDDSNRIFLRAQKLTSLLWELWTLAKDQIQDEVLYGLFLEQLLGEVQFILAGNTENLEELAERLIWWPNIRTNIPTVSRWFNLIIL